MTSKDQMNMEEMNSETWPGPLSSFPPGGTLLYTAQSKSHLSFEPPPPHPPFCDLSPLFTALCHLDLELQVFTLYTEDRKCLVSVDIIFYTVLIDKYLGDSGAL